MAKYTVGQEVWTQVSANEANRLKVFSAPHSPLNLKGTVSTIEGTKYIVLTTEYGDVETTEELIDAGMRAIGKIEEMRKLSEKCAEKRAEQAAAREAATE